MQMQMRALVPALTLLLQVLRHERDTVSENGQRPRLPLTALQVAAAALLLGALVSLQVARRRGGSVVAVVRARAATTAGLIT